MIERFSLKGLCRSFSFDCHGARTTNVTQVEIAEGEIPIYFEHNRARPIGRGRIKKVAHGWEMDAVLSLDSSDRFDEEIIRLIDLGMVRSLSIGYRQSLDDHDRMDARRKGGYDLEQIEIGEISICAQPGADPAAKIQFIGRLL